MNILNKWVRKRAKEEKAPQIGFAEFLKNAESEIDDLIRLNERWFKELPYGGAMTREAARHLEIEKRAVWRRVIYDAKRSMLPGLKWETSHDDKVCSECAKQDGRIYQRKEYDLLNELIMHVGCRCNLVPVRNI